MLNDHREMITNNNKDNIEASSNKGSTRDLLIKNIVRIIWDHKESHENKETTNKATNRDLNNKTTNRDPNNKAIRDSDKIFNPINKTTCSKEMSLFAEKLLIKKQWLFCII